MTTLNEQQQKLRDTFKRLSDELNKSVTSASNNKSLTQLQLDTNDNTQSELKKLDIQVVDTLIGHLNKIETPTADLHSGAKDLKDKYSSKSVWSGGDDNNAMDDLTSDLQNVIMRSEQIFFRNDLKDPTFLSSYVSYDNSANSYTNVLNQLAQVHFDTNPNSLDIEKVNINFKISTFGEKLVTASEYTDAWHNYRSYLTEEWGSTSFQNFLNKNKTSFTSDTTPLVTANTVTFLDDGTSQTISVIIGANTSTYVYNASNNKWEDNTDTANIKILKYNDGSGVVSETWMSKGLYEFFTNANPSTVLDTMYGVVDSAKDNLRLMKHELKNATQKIDIISDSVKLDSVAILKYELGKEGLDVTGSDETNDDSDIA
jgi:hypothetical protein